MEMIVWHDMGVTVSRLCPPEEEELCPSKELFNFPIFQLCPDEELLNEAFASQVPFIPSASFICCVLPRLLKWSTQTCSKAWTQSPLMAIFLCASSKHSSTVIGSSSPASAFFFTSLITSFRLITLGQNLQACWNIIFYWNIIGNKLQQLYVGRRHLRAFINVEFCSDWYQEKICQQ